MPDVTLLDYCNEDVTYRFNSETGRLTLPEKAASSGLQIAGYVLRKRIGVIRFHVITAAVFCEADRLLLWIPDAKVDLSRDAVHGKVRLVAPFVREFRLTKGEQVLYSCSYWHSGGRVWPDDGDIFSLVERITASPEAVARTHHIWAARLAGQPFVDDHT